MTDSRRQYERARVRAHGETVSTLEHLSALHDVERTYEIAFQTERDRRYAEVNVEKEKALKIKETADLAALQLARQIQEYKDEKANELREQISSERGHYATKDDLLNVTEKIESSIKPLTEWANTQQGRGAGLSDGWKYLLGFISILSTLSILFTLFHKSLGG